MRRVLTAALALAVLAGPAYAQDERQKDPAELERERQKKEMEDNERAYNETVRRTRTTAPAAKVDPWRGVRPADNSSSKR
jgi:hypothetical protein